MKRIDMVFRKKKPFIGYLTAGDGGKEYSLQCFLALIEGGVDLLEIGIPFSDPVADGPVIQMAMKRALMEKITPLDVLDLVSEIRKKSEIPIVLFSYYNPIFKAGTDFIEKAKEAGVDGFLIVDLPLEESQDLLKACKKLDLDLIFLLSVSTSLKRQRAICEQASGFLYYVMQKGTTGMRNDLPDDLHENLQNIRKEAAIPVCCGFGISNKEMASIVLTVSDGFVVGSYFVKAVGEKITPYALTLLAKQIDPRERCYAHIS